MIISAIILSLIGIGVSSYAWVVERKMRSDAGYKPACDLSDRISCSKPLQSQYSNLFFISNSIAGIFFYLLVAFVAWFDATKTLLILTSAGMLMTLFLAYLLYFKIRSLCLVCTSVYIVNSLLFLVSLLAVFY